MKVLKGIAGVVVACFLGFFIGMAVAKLAEWPPGWGLKLGGVLGGGMTILWIRKVFRGAVFGPVPGHEPDSEETEQ